jgi:hypothetical protein
MAETEREPSETNQTDTASALLGFLFFAAIFYFALVLPRLDDDLAQWLVTGAFVVGGAALYVGVRNSSRLADRMPAMLKAGKRASDFLVFVLVIGAIVLAAIYLAAEDKVVLLKIVTVVYFSLLPALLYLQFSSRKTLAVWKDFVVNLYKLQVDDPGNLPRPPTLSRFYPAWRDARKAAWKNGDLELQGKSRAKVEDDLELANQYRQKFRDLFGVVRSGVEPKSVLAINSPHKLQVVMATVLITLGWTFVVQPESVFGRSFAPTDFELARLPTVPTKTFAFAFLGAYFYILQMLVRRYFQNDLKSTAYINATMRIVIVILLVWVIDPLLDDFTQAQRNALAFVIGVFPTVGWQFLEQVLVRKPLGLVVRSLEPKHKLGDLDGLNIWYESRLLEVGVEDMQNLATADIVDLMLNTRIPVDRLVDWIDQAILYVRVEDKEPRDFLRGYGIRNATDLDDVLADDARATALDRLLNLRLVGVPQYQDDGLPSRLAAVHAAIETERNLQHVRAWKGFSVGEAWVPASSATHAPAAAEEEPPPAAAPVPA